MSPLPPHSFSPPRNLSLSDPFAFVTALLSSYASSHFSALLLSSASPHFLLLLAFSHHHPCVLLPLWYPVRLDILKYTKTSPLMQYGVHVRGCCSVTVWTCCKSNWTSVLLVVHSPNHDVCSSFSASGSSVLWSAGITIVGKETVIPRSSSSMFFAVLARTCSQVHSDLNRACLNSFCKAYAFDRRTRGIHFFKK